MIGLLNESFEFSTSWNSALSRNEVIDEINKELYYQKGWKYRNRYHYVKEKFIGEQREDEFQMMLNIQKYQRFDELLPSNARIKVFVDDVENGTTIKTSVSLSHMSSMMKIFKGFFAFFSVVVLLVILFSSQTLLEKLSLVLGIIAFQLFYVFTIKFLKKLFDRDCEKAIGYLKGLTGDIATIEKESVLIE